MIEINFLETLKNISGTKDKINTLRGLIETDENYAKIFENALDPFISYGIQSLPQYEPTDTECNWNILFIDLFKLSTMNHSNKSISLCKQILEKSGKYHKIIEKIILKNLDCGISIANFNKSLPVKMSSHKIHEYPCCLVSSDLDKVVSKFNWKEGVFSQEKCDGMRFNAILEDGRVRFYGRSGKEIFIHSESFKDEFKKVFGLIGEYVVDGELLVRKDGKFSDRKTGNGILNKAVRGTISHEESEMICCTVWDIIPIDLFKNLNYSDYTSVKNEYFSRFETLLSVVNSLHLYKINTVETKIVFSLEEANEDFHQKISEGKEGVILKSKHSMWKNTRVTDCVKLKEVNDCDLLVTDWIEGTGKYYGQLGALTCQSGDGKVVVNVGSGFSEDERKSLTKENTIGKIVTIEYNMRINDKTKYTDSLFLPRFVEIRSDKTLPNVSKEIR